MTAGPTALELAYFLQQCINALVVSALYMVLAVAYALVYGITNRIVLMFGDFATFGAFYGLFCVALLTAKTALGLGATLSLALIATLAGTAALGFATQRLVVRPLLGQSSQALLIATLGIAIVLQDSLRLTTGGREQWLPPLFDTPLLLHAAAGFGVHVTPMQLLTLLVAAILAGLLLLSMRATAFGRNWRACCQDSRLAALCGVDVPRTLALTFVVASLYAGVGGLVIALSYGGVSFYMGTMLGLKALLAAIMGGFGSLGGALLGGLLLGCLETFWSAYFQIEYRDVAVLLFFLLLLVLRPDGLVASPQRRDAAP